MSVTHRIQYVRDENNNPIITVAWHVLNKDDDMVAIRYAWSRCNPNDSINKKFGTKIAVARLNTERPGQCSSQIRLHLIAGKNGPSVTKTVAEFIRKQFKGLA